MKKKQEINYLPKQFFLYFQLIVTIIVNIIFIFPFYTIINIKYPIFKLLYGKFKLFNLITVSPEHQDNINLTIRNFADDFQIDEEHQERFFKLIQKFAKVEQTYVYDILEKEYCYLRIRYIFHIIQLAQYALVALAQVTKDNKKVCYYENKKYSSIEELIEELQNKLDAKGHDQIHIKEARREVQIRRLLAKMKKYNRLFFNFYLTIFTLFPIENMRSKISQKYMDIFNLMIALFDFYSVGHATPNQIYKSVAIQLYKYYLNDFTKEDLEKMIGELIELCFHLDKEYTNFNQIDQEPYIKNLIGYFPLFECDNNQAKEQFVKVKRYFFAKNLILPRFFPASIRQWTVTKYIQKPLPYYQKYALLTFFGFMQKKF